MKMKLTLTKKQKAFIDTHESEVLFGGAAGGGKSYGQVADALLFALKYPRSKQLILRRTFAELDKSLIRLALSLYPKEIYSFNQSSHTGKFVNGSKKSTYNEAALHKAIVKIHADAGYDPAKITMRKAVDLYIGGRLAYTPID